MSALRVALGQLDAAVGDLAGNADLIVACANTAAEQGAHLIALPEMALTGYPVEDLALRGSFLAASRDALRRLAVRLAEEGAGEVLVIVGFLDRADGELRLGLPAGLGQNAAAFLHRGAIVARYAKHHLPNYGVFDERRYFVPGTRLPVVRLHGIDVAVTICEDLWQDGGPVAVVREAGAGLLVVINGSPYERAKDDTRLELARRRSEQAGCPLAYVNLVGGQDELVFDGDSLVVLPDGTLVARAPQFEEHLLVVDLDLEPGRDVPEGAAGPPLIASDGTPILIDRTTISAQPLAPYEPLMPVVTRRLPDCAEVWGALVIGLHDYVVKNGFSSVVLGLSGGIDSAVVAAIAVDALGADKVYGVSMPSGYSSEHSKDDAADLARRTGLHFSVVPIAPMVSAYLETLELTGLAEENLQARVRGTTLMGLSNQHGHLVLATGNKTELAVGYSTIYGDAVGGFAPLKDVPKTLVWDLARWRNGHATEGGGAPPIPQTSIDKPPSAELRPGQLDSDSLPDYTELDHVLEAYVGQDRGSADLVAGGLERELVERVLRLVDLAEYKRRQYPPGPKISLRAFGRDRRLPISNRWREVAQ